jgi:hypothetical protein
VELSPEGPSLSSLASPGQRSGDPRASQGLRVRYEATIAPPPPTRGRVPPNTPSLSSPRSPGGRAEWTGPFARLGLHLLHFVHLGSGGVGSTLCRDEPSLPSLRSPGARAEWAVHFAGTTLHFLHFVHLGLGWSGRYTLRGRPFTSFTSFTWTLGFLGADFPVGPSLPSLPSPRTSGEAGEGSEGPIGKSKSLQNPRAEVNGVKEVKGRPRKVYRPLRPSPR